MKTPLLSLHAAVSHPGRSPLPLAILIGILSSIAPLVAQEAGDYKVGEVVEYRIGDTAPFLVKITRIDADGIYAEFLESGVKLGQYCAVSSLRRTPGESAASPVLQPEGAPPADAAPVGEGVISETEFLQLLQDRLGPAPKENPKREQIFQELAAEIKSRGVSFRVVPQSEFRKKLYTFGCPSTVTFTLQDNFGPPGAQAGLLSMWTLDKVGAAVDFNKDGKRFRENESAVASIGTLSIAPEGTYSWREPTLPTLEGSWREATAVEMKYQGGAGIVLLKAKAGWDWIVAKNRNTPLEGDRITVVELKSRQVKEYGKK